MLIAYRKYSLPIGLTPAEQYTTGGWHEKRSALIRALEGRGHEVIMISPPTKLSRGLWDYESNLQRRPEYIIVEMSAHNPIFNHKDMAETLKILNVAECPIIWIIDDPELKVELRSEFFPEGPLKIPNLHLWINAAIPESTLSIFCSQQFVATANVEIGAFHARYFPAHALLDYGDFDGEHSNLTPVYVGSFGEGKGAILKELSSKAKIQIYTKDKKATLLASGMPPRQPERRKFYSQFALNLGLQGRKHKRLCWNTGRIFHALAAGTPSLVEQDSSLAGYFPAIDVQNFPAQIHDVIANRPRHLATAMELIEHEKHLIHNLFTTYGL